MKSIWFSTAIQLGPFDQGTEAPRHHRVQRRASLRAGRTRRRGWLQNGKRITAILST